MGSFNTPHPFRDFLYWYCTWQFGGVAFLFGLATVLTLLTYHGAFPPDWLMALGNFMDSQSGIAVCVIFPSIIMCTAIARAHGLGFWKGLGGFWLGSLINFVCFMAVWIVLVALKQAWGLPSFEDRPHVRHSTLPGSFRSRNSVAPQ